MKGLTPTSSRRRRSRSASSFSALSCVMSALSTAILSVPFSVFLQFPFKMVVEFHRELIELFVHALHRFFDVLSVHLKLGPRDQPIIDVIPYRRLIFSDRRERFTRKISESREKNPNNEVKKLVCCQRSLR